MSDLRPRSELLQRVLSGSAALVAISALAVSVYQAKITREQQKMSAWPYVSAGHGGPVDGRPYSFHVYNQGVGPALVRSVRVYVDGRPQRTWGAVVRTMGTPAETTLVYSSFHRGSVVLPGADREVLIIKGAQARPFWIAAQTRFRYRVCYCSLYDDCWVYDTASDADLPPAVRACDTGVGEFED